MSEMSRHAFGAVGTALPSTADDLALLLIHEFQHVKLGALQDMYDLLNAAGGGWHPAIRGPSRPSGRFPCAPPRSPAVRKLLETIREQLRTGKHALLLRGTGGVGKPLLAQEFAYRYKGDYDIVWHIQAERRDLAVEQYAAMGRRLGVAERKKPTDTARAVRDALDLGEPYHRWLLILDNADQARDLPDFLASGRSGHVLITSQRSKGWNRYAETIEIGVFTRPESVSHLRRRLPDCGPQEANLVAEALGDLPIAVEQAAAGIKQTGLDAREYIRLLQRSTAGVETSGKGDQIADITKATGGTWGFAIGWLRKNYPPAVRLLQPCSYFSAAHASACGPPPERPTTEYRLSSSASAMAATSFAPCATPRPGWRSESPYPGRS
jgi:hypothetical protein